MSLPSQKTAAIGYETRRPMSAQFPVGQFSTGLSNAVTASALDNPSHPKLYVFFPWGKERTQHEIQECPSGQ